MWLDVSCVPISPIYSSVGYCVAYLAQGLSTTFIRIAEVSSTLSLFIPKRQSVELGLYVSIIYMKKLFVFFLPMAALMAGCEKESNGTHEQDSYNHLVKEVICEYWDFEGGDQKSVFEFKYDDKNRLCYVTEKRYYDDQLDADNVYRYSYDVDELLILGDMNESRYDEMTRFAVKYTYKFENDLMVSELWEQTWGDYSTETTFIYDNAGLLSRVTGESEGLSYSPDYMVSWNNGNIVGPNIYSQNYNNANLDFSSLLWGEFDPKADRNIFKGIHNKNLVEKETDGDYLLLYSYEFDQYGSPVKIEASDNKGWNSTKLYIEYHQ